MKTLVRALCLVAIVAVICPLLLAQWPSYPTAPGAPKNASGQPDLNGPTPRTPDGKPDLSGIWNNGGGGGGGGGGRGGGGAAAGGRGGGGAAAPGGRGGAGAGGGAAAAGAPQRGGDAAAANTGIPNASFGNAGQGMAGGLPYQPWAAELVAKRKADFSKDNPDAHCLPMGFMQFHTHPEPRKIIQTPGLLLIIYEANSGLRQIYMDGRALPKKDDVQPWWYGYSVGKWEGDTLVVETTGFIDNNVWLDVQGSPLSDAAKVTEKFRRPNFGTLEIEVTVDDPKAYTKTWTVKVNQRILLDTELIEFICEDRDATHYVGAAK